MFCRRHTFVSRVEAVWGMASGECWRKLEIIPYGPYTATKEERGSEHFSSSQSMTSSYVRVTAVSRDRQWKMCILALPNRNICICVLCKGSCNKLYPQQNCQSVEDMIAVTLKHAPHRRKTHYPVNSVTWLLLTCIYSAPSIFHENTP